jgi:hypothetical protein
LPYLFCDGVGPAQLEALAARLVAR